MEATEVIDPAFWQSEAPRVLAPPRLEEEAARLEGLLTGGEVVFATSGSSGHPKWAGLARDSLLASAEAVNRHLESDRHDVWMLCLPLYHVGGFGVAARAHASGSTLHRFVGRWNAMRFAEELEEREVSLTSLVPTQVHDLVQCELPAPPALRAVVVGGAELDAALGATARELGWPLLQSYGMTETASQVATAPLASLEEVFAPSPLPLLDHWQARISPEGRLALKGPATIKAYYRVEGGTVVAEDPLDAEGWFMTSDLADLESGGLVIRGRADRQVKILGELVDVAALERELQAHADEETALRIVIVADERRGARLFPVVETSREAEVEEVLSVINERLPGFARLAPPVFVASLPRTALGKIDEAALRNEIPELRTY